MEFTKQSQISWTRTAVLLTLGRGWSEKGGLSQYAVPPNSSIPGQGWPWTCCPHASTSWMLGLQAWATIHTQCYTVPGIESRALCMFSRSCTNCVTSHPGSHCSSLRCLLRIFSCGPDIWIYKTSHTFFKLLHNKSERKWLSFKNSLLCAHIWHAHLWVWAWTRPSICVEVGEQPWGVGSLFLLCVPGIEFRLVVQAFLLLNKSPILIWKNSLAYI